MTLRRSLIVINWVSLVITNDLLDFSASAREILDDLIKFN